MGLTPSEARSRAIEGWRTKRMKYPSRFGASKTMKASEDDSRPRRTFTNKKDLQNEIVQTPAGAAKRYPTESEGERNKSVARIRKRREDIRKNSKRQAEREGRNVQDFPNSYGARLHPQSGKGSRGTINEEALNKARKIENEGIGLENTKTKDAGKGVLDRYREKLAREGHTDSQIEYRVSQLIEKRNERRRREPKARQIESSARKKINEEFGAIYAGGTVPPTTSINASKVVGKTPEEIKRHLEDTLVQAQRPNLRVTNIEQSKQARAKAEQEVARAQESLARAKADSGSAVRTKAATGLPEDSIGKGTQTVPASIVDRKSTQKQNISQAERNLEKAEQKLARTPKPVEAIDKKTDVEELVNHIVNSHVAPTEQERVRAASDASKLLSRLQSKAQDRYDRELEAYDSAQIEKGLAEANVVLAVAKREGTIRDKGQLKEILSAQGRYGYVPGNNFLESITQRSSPLKSAEEMYQDSGARESFSRTKWAARKAKAKFLNETFTDPQPEFFKGVRGQVSMNKELTTNKRTSLERGDITKLLDKNNQNLGVGKLGPGNNMRKDPIDKASKGLIPNKWKVAVISDGSRKDNGEPITTSKRLRSYDQWTQRELETRGEAVVGIAEQRMLRRRRRNKDGNLVDPGQQMRIELGKRDAVGVEAGQDGALRRVFESPNVSRSQVVRGEEKGKRPMTAYIATDVNGRSYMVDKEKFDSLDPGRQWEFVKAIENKDKAGGDQENVDALLDKRVKASKEQEAADQGLTVKEGKIRKESVEKMTAEEQQQLDRFRQRAYYPRQVEDVYVPQGASVLTDGAKERIMIKTPSLSFRRKGKKQTVIEEQAAFINLDQDQLSSPLGRVAKYGLIEPARVKETYDRADVMTIVDPTRMPPGFEQPDRGVSADRQRALSRMTREPAFREKVFAQVAKTEGKTRTQVEEEYQQSLKDSSREGMFKNIAAAAAMSGFYKGQRRYRESVKPNVFNRTIGTLGNKITRDPSFSKRYMLDIAPIAKEAMIAPMGRGVEKAKFYATSPFFSTEGTTLPKLARNQFGYTLDPTLTDRLRFGRRADKFVANNYKQRLIESRISTSYTKNISERVQKEGIRGALARQKAGKILSWRSKTGWMRDDLIKDIDTTIGELNQTLNQRGRTIQEVRAGVEAPRATVTTRYGDQQYKSEIRNPLQLKNMLIEMKKQAAGMDIQDEISLSSLERASKGNKSLFPRANRWKGGNFTPNEKVVAAGAGAVALAGVAAYGVHKYKQRQEKKRGEIPKSFTNRYLPPAFNTPVPLPSGVQVRKRGAFEQNTFNEVVGIAGVEKPKLAGKFEKRTIALRPEDHGLRRDAPILGRPQIKLRKDKGDKSLAKSLVIPVANPKNRYSQVPQGYKVSVRGRNLPGVIEVSKPYSYQKSGRKRPGVEKLKPSSKTSVRRMAEKEALVARYAGTSDEARIRAMYSGDQKIVEMFRDPEAVRSARLHNPHLVSAQAGSRNEAMTNVFERQKDSLGGV